MPWLEFHSPTNQPRGARFGYWGENSKPRSSYRFVLAGTRSKSRDERDSDGEEDEEDENGGELEGEGGDGVAAASSSAPDVESLQRQLKARLKTERSLRQAKRKTDHALIALRKVNSHVLSTSPSLP